jgi:hypothetical protein
LEDQAQMRQSGVSVRRRWAAVVLQVLTLTLAPHPVALASGTLTSWLVSLVQSRVSDGAAVIAEYVSLAASG